MLKLNNLLNLFRKNALFTAILLFLAFIFSVYVNYSSINFRLLSNNKIVANDIKNITKQYIIKLDLNINNLEINPDLNSLNFDDFSAFYYLDDDGLVISKYTKDSEDHIEKFVEINTKTLGDNYYKSDLILSEDYQGAVYFAKKLDNSYARFLVAKLDLTNFLKQISKTDTDFAIIDSYGNVLYSTNTSVLNALENINDIKYSNVFSKIYQSKSGVTLTTLDSIVSVRSFVLFTDFFNNYFYISLMLLTILILSLINHILDSLFLQNGIVKQINYCYGLQKTSRVDEYQDFDLIDGSDLLSLQKQTSINVLENNTLKKEYAELEQRLTSMFCESTIPMLLIDAYTAKIIRANQSALEFYSQKDSSMTKMNIYMLGRKNQTEVIQDPIILAGNMRNSIKNQGACIKTKHYLDGRDYKEVQIFPFSMRSDGFNCDVLMILDNKITGIDYDDVKNQYEALEKSFIANMDFTLESGKLRIKNHSKNIDKVLGYNISSHTYFKELLHKSCLESYKEVLQEIKKIKNTDVLNYFKTLEHTLFLKQSNKRYTRCKANFVIFKKHSLNNKKGKELNIVLYLAILKQDILEEDIRNLISYDDVYRQTNSILCVVDKNFDILDANAKFRQILKVQTISNIHLKDLLKDKAEEIIFEIKRNQNGDINEIVYLKDTQNKIHPCKLSYAISKNIDGDNVYNLLFRQVVELARLDDFMSYCVGKNITNDNFESIYYGYYYQTIGKKILNNEVFDNLDFEKLKDNLNNVNIKNENNLEKARYLLELIKVIETKNTDKIAEIYNQGYDFFKGEINE